MLEFLLSIDPIAFKIGPLEVRWYGLAYLAGMLLGLQYAKWIIGNHREKNKFQILKLVSSINAQIWLGHFDVWDKEGLIIYRNSSIIDRNNLNLENVETLLLDAVNSIDLYFPAFQYILWAGKTSEEALSTVLFETRGEA